MASSKLLIMCIAVMNKIEIKTDFTFWTVVAEYTVDEMKQG